MKQLQITTPRFLLRPITTQDVTLRYSSWFDEKVTAQYIKSANFDHGIESLKAYIRDREKRNDVMFFGIFTSNQGEHIGNIKYEPVDIANQCAIVGMLIGESEWRGKGVASEVLQYSTGWLNKTLGIKEFLLGVNLDNDAAIRAYEKAGFKREETDKTLLNPEYEIIMVLRLSP